MEKHIENIRHAVGRLQKNLECVICLELLQDPVSTKCSHNFCSGCVDRMFIENNISVFKCPLCNASVNRRNVSQNPKLTKIVNGARNIMEAFKKDSLNFNDSQQHPKIDSIQNQIPAGTKDACNISTATPLRGSTLCNKIKKTNLRRSNRLGSSSDVNEISFDKEFSETGKADQFVGEKCDAIVAIPKESTGCNEVANNAVGIETTCLNKKDAEKIADSTNASIINCHSSGSVKRKSGDVEDIESNLKRKRLEIPPSILLSQEDEKTGNTKIQGTDQAPSAMNTDIHDADVNLDNQINNSQKLSQRDSHNSKIVSSSPHPDNVSETTVGSADSRDINLLPDIRDIQINKPTIISNQMKIAEDEQIESGDETESLNMPPLPQSHYSSQASLHDSCEPIMASGQQFFSQISDTRDDSIKASDNESQNLLCGNSVLFIGSDNQQQNLLSNVNDQEFKEQSYNQPKTCNNTVDNVEVHTKDQAIQCCLTNLSLEENALTTHTFIPKTTTAEIGVQWPMPKRMLENEIISLRFSNLSFARRPCTASAAIDRCCGEAHKTTADVTAYIPSCSSGERQQPVADLKPQNDSPVETDMIKTPSVNTLAVKTASVTTPPVKPSSVKTPSVKTPSVKNVSLKTPSVKPASADYENEKQSPTANNQPSCVQHTTTPEKTLIEDDVAITETPIEEPAIEYTKVLNPQSSASEEDNDSELDSPFFIPATPIKGVDINQVFKPPPESNDSFWTPSDDKAEDEPNQTTTIILQKPFKHDGSLIDNIDNDIQSTSISSSQDKRIKVIDEAPSVLHDKTISETIPSAGNKNENETGSYSSNVILADLSNKLKRPMVVVTSRLNKQQMKERLLSKAESIKELNNYHEKSKLSSNTTSKETVI